MNRILIDLKENHKGEITGRVKFPKDSAFVFEALVEVLVHFSASCEVPIGEIAVDLLNAVRAEQGVALQ